MGLASVEGVFRRPPDVIRRVEVGLADLEVDDVAALRFQRSGSGEHLEGGFGSQSLHARCEVHVRARYGPVCPGVKWAACGRVALESEPELQIPG